VLIVDDNRTNCDLYQQMCSGWGYRSSLAKDGVTGLTALEDALREGDPYRLILLDQQMPGLTGLDLAGLVRSRPDLRDIQMILLSSSLNRQESERAKELGLARALAKPVKRATLQEVILETFGVRGERGRPVTKDPFAVAKGFDPMRVLLVEDNLINQNLASRRLKKLGHEVTLAEDGQKALEIVQKGSFDCILMDIQMPGMDGFEATQKIREYEVESNRLHQHIIAMTAHAMKGDRERCLDAGMDDYISKPFRAEILKEKLELAAHAKIERTKSLSDTRGGGFALRLRAMDAEHREDVLAAAPMFLKAFPKDILKLQNAVSQNDFKECYYMAHTFKGVSGIFECELAIALAEEVEVACEAEDPKTLEPAVESLVKVMYTLASEVEIALS
jgi:CheY-like chemotaxis protein